MAARVTKIRHDENTRSKIQAGRIIEELQKHVFGQREMTATQVNAARTLLAKTMPDMQAVEISGEVQKTYVARMPAKVGGIDEWQKTYIPPQTMTKQ